MIKLFVRSDSDFIGTEARKAKQQRIRKAVLRKATLSTDWLTNLLSTWLVILSSVLKFMMSARFFVFVSYYGFPSWNPFSLFCLYNIVVPNMSKVSKPNSAWSGLLGKRMQGFLSAQHRKREWFWLTWTERRFFHFGLMKNEIPLTAPGRVRPRISNMNKITYGNVAVK